MRNPGRLHCWLLHVYFIDIAAFYLIKKKELAMRITARLKTLPGIVAAIAMLGTAPAPALAQAGGEKPGIPMGMSKGDQKIVMDLAQGNMAEIECARLAQKKAQDDNAKTFAQQMFADHSKALADVQQLASAKGVTLPTEIDKQQKAMIDKLSGMSGEAFDKAFLAQCGVSAHKKMHSMLASAEKKAKDPDLKALAARFDPVVEQHLKEAQQMGKAKPAEKGEKYPVGVDTGK
jgi:putative membrane protein